MPNGPNRKRPASRSSRLPKTLGESKRGTQSQSTAPSGATSAPVWQLDNREDAMAAYAAMAGALAEGGVELLVLATIFAVEEAVSAVEGIQSATNLPLVVSFSFDMGTRTMMGLSPTDAVSAVVPMGIAAVGTNCGRSLADADLVVGEILAAAGDVPVWVKPNAGVPQIIGALVVFEAGPGHADRARRRLRRAGREDRGGCCGSTPEHVAAIARALGRSEVVSTRVRSSGVLLHVTSLPSGRLDEDAYEFVDWLVEAGQSWWQLLPLRIPDELGSPYSSSSACAGFEGLL